jgi:hypothetical protein
MTNSERQAAWRKREAIKRDRLTRQDKFVAWLLTRLEDAAPLPRDEIRSNALAARDGDGQ